MPLLQLLVENGGLATTNSKVSRSPCSSLCFGSARLLPLSISASGASCRNMFILQSAHVALSISWPNIERPRGAASETLRSSEPEPQAGS
jgi:hypothetical protein